MKLQGFLAKRHHLTTAKWNWTWPLEEKQKIEKEIIVVSDNFSKDEAISDILERIFGHFEEKRSGGSVVVGFLCWNWDIFHPENHLSKSLTISKKAFSHNFSCGSLSLWCPVPHTVQSNLLWHLPESFLFLLYWHGF